MNLIFLSPALLAISVSGTSVLSTAEVLVPAPEPAPPALTDPRTMLADEFRRLEGLRAQVQAAEQAAEIARQPVESIPATRPAPATVVAPTPPGPRATLLATVRLQPASGLDSGARGLTPESDWRKVFPQKNRR